MKRGKKRAVSPWREDLARRIKANKGIIRIEDGTVCDVEAPHYDNGEYNHGLRESNGNIKKLD
jgi:hypothetical protein